MKQRVRIIIPIIVILALAGYAIRQNYLKNHAAQAGTIPGNGVIEATEVDVSAKISGRVISLFAREGDAVTTGQLIAILDSEELAGQVEQSQGNLQAVEANYDELKAGTRAEDLRKAQAQYDAAQEALKQAQAQRDLVYSGTRAEQLAQLRAALQQAQAQLALVKAGPRKEEIARLRATYDQAQARVALLKAGTRDEEIAQLTAALAQAQASLDDANSEYTRIDRLFAQGAVSARQLDQSTAKRDSARAAVDAASQRLREAKNGARPQEIQEAQAASEAAHQQLQQALAGSRPQEIEQAQAAVDVAQQRLAEAEHGARPQERTAADAQVAQAQAQLTAARAALDLANAGARTEERTAAKARVTQARGTLKTAVASEDQTRIIAPTSGRVTLRNVEPGEMVTPGLPLIRLAEVHSVWIRVYVPEEQIGKVKLGQRALVTTDAFPKTRFPGRVTEIAEEPEFTPKNVQTKEERVKLVYGVKIEMANPDSLLKPGMPGDAVIYTR